MPPAFISVGQGDCCTVAPQKVNLVKGTIHRGTYPGSIQLCCCIFSVGRNQWELYKWHKLTNRYYIGMFPWRDLPKQQLPKDLNNEETWTEMFKLCSLRVRGRDNSDTHWHYLILVFLFNSVKSRPICSITQRLSIGWIFMLVHVNLSPVNVH